MMSELHLQERANSLLSDNDSQKLQISVSCRNLADLDTLTVTDSFLIVRLQEHQKPSRDILRTKTYQNDLNPNYAETAIVEYFFQVRQNLLFQIYHDAHPPKLVGRANCSVGQVFGSPKNRLTLNLQNNLGVKAGQIIIRCEKVSNESNALIKMILGAESLPSSTGLCCGSIDPFFRIFRKSQQQDILIYESQVILNNQNPNFKQLQLPERRLKSNQPLEIKFYDYSKWGKHTYVGSSMITLQQLGNNKNYPIFNNQHNKGIITIKNLQKIIKYGFGDFIQAGLQLSLVTCIDFTGSNGIPSSPDSLHYFNAYKMSPYALALTQVSKILLDYDYDRLVPVYGFGAKVRMPNFDTKGKVHHCFPINGNEYNPDLFQVEGVLDAYRNCLQYLQFAGPTLFSGLLRQAIQKCKQFQKQTCKYMVLLILTDGQINDHSEVIDLIIECGRLPLSIIIVGIGNGDFGIMHQLDDDDKKMKDSKGNPSIRDLVQFVQFSKYSGNGIQLAKEVLEELPRQVVEYFQLMGMSPKDIKKQNNDINFQIQNTNQTNVKLSSLKFNH